MLLACRLCSGIMNKDYATAASGLEIHFAVNYFGHFQLFQLLRPVLEASATPAFASRVITLSSLGHHGCGPLDLSCIRSPSPSDQAPILSYRQSKHATLYLANEIYRRFGAHGIHAYAASPGTILTPLADNLPQVVKDGLAVKAAQRIIKSAEQGAATSVWAAVAKELEGLGGL